MNPTDKEQFLSLVRENQGIIYKICNSYCLNKDDREDLAQEIIYQLWKSAAGFNPGYKFSTWMYRVALNVAISHYRKQQKRQNISIPEKERKDIPEFPEEADKEENLKQLELFINELKELDRALMLLYLESKSYSEIAEIVGISETNVATKLSRIKEKLRLRFQNLQHNGTTYR